ncbi:hypothetical protein I79_024426 [Cricetulus griseus]|uniref:Uncharacterized protein n=1 Tax=Cricetulus griseus TaxID=10029 RepID=G3IKM3_CRIGR|nr:hypothetical protein I79_024426 [Cricetulus griseus]
MICPMYSRNQSRNYKQHYIISALVNLFLTTFHSKSLYALRVLELSRLCNHLFRINLSVDNYLKGDLFERS